MDIKVKTRIPNGVGGIIEKTGTLVDVKDAKEPWSEYTLDDGTIIRMKQTVLQIVKIDGPMIDGVPQYSVQAQPIINVIPKTVS